MRSCSEAGMKQTAALRMPSYPDGRLWGSKKEDGNMRMYTATIKKDALNPGSRIAYYLRQKLLFVLVMVLVSVIPLIGISFFSFRYYKSSWVEGTSTELAGLADSRKEMIELFLADQNNLLASLVDIYPPGYLSDQSNLEKVFQAINRSGVITDLGVIDNSGVHRSYVGPFGEQLAGKNYTQAGWFKEVTSRGQYTSDIFSGFRGVPHFIVAVADPSRTVILRATVNSDLFNALLASAEVGPGGDAFILGKNGEPQTPSRLGVLDMPFPIEDGARTQTRVHQTNDFIYATTSLKNGEWVLVLKEDINSSLAEFYVARNRAIILIAIAVLAIASAATLLASSIINRIREADIKRLALNNKVLEMEKMALVGRLASSVSHEINNPLQIIENQAGWINELLDDEKQGQVIDPSEYRKAVGKIRAHVGRAKSITHRLLGFSRGSEIEQMNTDINRLLEETVSFLETEVNQNRIVINRNLQSNLPEVSTDPAQLQQVFLNVINNAIDAIGKDGTITLKTGVANGNVVTEITDTGPGISEATRKHLFDPFFTTKNGKNAGLGLSISYNIMQRLNGDIEAKSGDRGGSIFKVTVPVCTEGTLS